MDRILVDIHVVLDVLLLTRKQAQRFGQPMMRVSRIATGDGNVMEDALYLSMPALADSTIAAVARPA